GDLKTANGKVTFKLKGTSVAGDKKVKIRVDEYETEHTVKVEDVNINISVASSIQTGTRNAAVNVSYSSNYGNLSGLKVALSNHRGQLEQKDFILDSSQQVTTSLNVGEFRGEGKIFSYVGEKIAERSFDVIDPIGTPYILDTVIVSDRNAPGNLSISGMDIEYTNQTTVMVPGTVGQSIDLSLIDYLSPALIPTLNFPMTSAPANGEVSDSKRGHLGDAVNINYSPVMSPEGIGAFQ